MSLMVQVSKGVRCKVYGGLGRKWVTEADSLWCAPISLDEQQKRDLPVQEQSGITG